MFDVLITPSMRHRPVRLMEWLAASAEAHGIDARAMQRYEPRNGSTLVVYGLGGRDRLPHAQAHPGHYIAIDAGYWNRKSEDRSYRASIDGFHCPGLIMKGEFPGAERWRAAALSITNRSHPDGNIILVGNGPKSGAVGATGWAAEKSREIRKTFPRYRVVYRPKRHFIEPHVECDAVAREDPIERVLELASLVVCRHSNVAVDACRMGIPAVCEDGAAAAIYPSRLEDAAKQPSEAKRIEFLQRLAWWQWSESEIRNGDIWPWLVKQL